MKSMVSTMLYILEITDESAKDRLELSVTSVICMLEELFDLVVKGEIAECLKNKDNQKKILFLRQYLLPSQRQEIKDENADEDQIIATQLRMIKDNFIPYLLSRLNYFFSDIQKSLLNEYSQKDIFDYLASILEKFLPETPEIQKLLQESLALSQHPGEQFQQQVIRTSEKVANSMEEQQHAVAVIQRILPNELDHVVQPLARVAKKRGLQIEEIKETEIASLIYKNNQSNIEQSAKIWLRYELHAEQVISAWKVFIKAIDDCNSCPAEDDSFKIKTKVLVQSLLNIEIMLRTIFSGMKGEELQLQIFNALCAFLRNKKIQTLSSNIDTDPIRYRALQEAKIFMEAAIQQAPINFSDDEADLESQQDSYSDTLKISLVNLLSVFVQGGELQNGETPEELKKLQQSRLEKLLPDQEERKEAYGEVLLNMTNTTSSRAKKVVLKAIAGEKLAQTAIVKPVVSHESLMLTDDKGEMQYQPKVDQAAYRYRIAKQKYIISGEETTLLLQAINHPIVGCSKLVPKLSAEDREANEQNENGPQILSYQDFIEQMTALIQQLESENKNSSWRYLGINKHRVDHLKAATDFIQYLLHKYNQVTHPEKRLQGGQWRGDAGTYQNFISELKIVKAKKGMDDKNASFRRKFSHTVNKLSSIFSSNQALKDLKSHYLKRINCLNGMKQQTQRIKTKHVGEWDRVSSDQWSGMKNTRDTAVKKSLQAQGRFFLQKNLNALNKPPRERSIDCKEFYIAVGIEKGPLTKIIVGDPSLNFIKKGYQYRDKVQDFMDHSKLENFDPESDEAMDRVGKMIDLLSQEKKKIKQHATQYVEALIGYIDTVQRLRKILERINSQCNQHGDEIMKDGLNDEIWELNQVITCIGSHRHPDLTEETRARSQAQMLAIRDCLQDINTQADVTDLLEMIKTVLPKLQNHQKYELGRIKRTTQEVKVSIQGMKYLAEHATNQLAKPLPSQ